MENKLYNLKSLEKIAGGNTDFIQKMIDLFLKITPVHVEEIKSHFKNKKYKEIGDVAHGMKPSIDQMGIISLYQTIRDLENEGKNNGRAEKIEKLIKEIDEVLSEVCLQLVV